MSRSQRALAILALGLGSIAAMPQAATATPPPGYSLVWSDEFSGAVGSLPSTQNWAFGTGNNFGWGNGELENYVADTAHSSIISDPNATDGKALQITATHDNTLYGASGQFSSCRLESIGKVNTTYGYVEVRAKAPQGGNGIWPAAWMLGSDFPTVQWPACGEQDIMEIFGAATNTNLQSWHVPNADWSGQYTLPNNGTFDQAYHTFGLLWNQQGVYSYDDGVLTGSHNASDSPGWIFNHPNFFLINLAIGGNASTLAGTPDPSTVFPQHFDIDYIRLYEPSTQPQSPGYGTVTDTCDDFSVAYNTSGGDLVIDNSNPNLFNGDAGRISRTFDDTAFVNYKYTNITAATVSVGTNTSDNTPITLWYSTNGGVTYTAAIDNVSTITPTASGWGTYTVTATNLPSSGVTDLKVQMAPTVIAWDHQIMSVKITSNSAVATPPAPTELTATGVSGGVALSWQAASGATSYDIYRSTTPYNEIAAPPINASPTTTGVTGTSYTDSGLVNGQIYYYMIAAADSAGVSGQTPQVSATPNGSATCGSTPAAPTGLAASGTSSSGTTLTWSSVTPPVNCAINGYTVYQNRTAITTTGSTTFAVSGLAPSTTYGFTVAAVDSLGTSAQSATVNVTTSGSNTPPSTPSNVAASSGNAHVNVTWAASSGATSYAIYRSTTSGGEGSTPYATSSSAGYNDTGVTNGTTYYYKIAGVNTVGTSTLSTEVSATPQTPPGAPTNLTAVGGISQVRLSWTAVTGATSYNVYRGTSTGSENSTPVGTTSSATYTDTGVGNGTTYYYTVAAVSGSGTSAMSNEANATPSSTIAINCGGSASGSWQADNSFSGGTAVSVSNTINLSLAPFPAPTQAVMQTERDGTFTYTIGGLTPNSAHTVSLFFSENNFNAIGQRQFNVAINGNTALSNFDVFANTGAQYKAIEQSFSTSANASGQIVIAFTTVKYAAEINGIAIQ